MSHRLEDLDVYNIADAFSNDIWEIVTTWDYFTKDTVGKQLVRSSDSISANIAEGFGRFHFKEIKTFATSVVVPLSKPKVGLIKQKKEN